MTCCTEKYPIYDLIKRLQKQFKEETNVAATRASIATILTWELQPLLASEGYSAYGFQVDEDNNLDYELTSTFVVQITITIDGFDYVHNAKFSSYSLNYSEARV